MPPTRSSRSYPTAFSSNELFQFSSTTTDIRHVYLLLAGNRHLRDNYTTFILLWQMIIRQEEETERRWQHEINKLNLLHKFTEATFEEACFGGLDNILQPVIQGVCGIWILDHGLGGWFGCQAANFFFSLRIFFGENSSEMARKPIFRNTRSI